ncbi:glycoside hydrolase, partial [Oryctes borbonicus]
DKSNFVELIMNLRKAFDDYNYTLTAALDPSKDTIDYGYNVTSLSMYLDYMLIWAYDFHGATWSRNIGHNAQLYSNDLLSASFPVNYLVRLGADPAKIVMGVPSYGRNFIALDVIDTSTKLPGLEMKFNGSFTGPFTQEDGFLGYNEICLEFKERPKDWKIFWDDFAKVPFAVNGEKFISYDDVRSVREKVKFAIIKRLGGIMVWELDTDDFRGDCRQQVDGYYDYPLLRTINNELANDVEDSDNFIDSEINDKAAAVLGNN